MKRQDIFAAMFAVARFHGDGRRIGGRFETRFGQAGQFGRSQAREECREVEHLTAFASEGPSYLVAVDRRTGEQRWKTPRQSKRAGYSTPCVYQVPGRPAELIFTEWKHGITGIAPLTGQVRWAIDCFGKETERAITSPIIAGDVIFGTCGFVTSDKHCVAVKPNDADGKVQVKELFRVEKTAPHLPTPIAFNGRLFLWTEKGIVSSVKLETGEVTATKRIGGNFSTSPVCIDGKLYGISGDGEVIVLKADDRLEELARNSLDEPCRATPAVFGGRLFLRTMSQLLPVGRKCLVENVLSRICGVPAKKRLTADVWPVGCAAN